MRVLAFLFYVIFPGVCVAVSMCYCFVLFVMFCSVFLRVCSADLRLSGLGAKFSMWQGRSILVSWSMVLFGIFLISPHMLEVFCSYVHNTGFLFF